MLQQTKTIGIIGMGSFGSLVSQYGSRWARVIFYDTRRVASKKASRVRLEEVCKADIVFFCVPLGAYGSLLPKVAKHLSQETIFVDIASVKLEPERLINKFLPSHKHVLLSHPLFGPQSASNSLEGHKFIVCKASGKARKLVHFLGNNLGLDIIRKSADEHDKAMAQIQGLTFFIARGLRMYGLLDNGLETPSYAWLKGLEELDKHHSDELLNTIESHNKHARAARQKLLKELHVLDESF